MIMILTAGASYGITELRSYTPVAQAQAAGHPLRSFENPQRILDLFRESWRILKDFENLSNILGGILQDGVR